MTEFQKDILVGTLFIAGIFGLISGAFIISALLFVATVVYSKAHQPIRLES